MNLDISIMVPDRTFLETKVGEIILPTSTGQMGVLPNHATLITSLDVGIMLIRLKTEWSSIALMGGFALIKDNKVIILANNAFHHSEVTLTDTEKAFLEAEQNYAKAQTVQQKILTSLVRRRALILFQLAQMKS